MLEFVLKGGPLMWPILFCSVAALTLALKKWAAYRAVDRKLSAPAGDIARAETGPMIALVRALSRGADERELSLVGTRQVRELERGLGLLSLISVI
ncbi:MAG: MotA/TolQ/ExbB proton channel family protein, partial [Desulfovibrionales bacterium]